MAEVQISRNVLVSVATKVADKLDKANKEQEVSPCEDMTYNLAFSHAELILLVFSLTTTANGIAVMAASRGLLSEEEADTMRDKLRERTTGTKDPEDVEVIE